MTRPSPWADRPAHADAPEPDAYDVRHPRRGGTGQDAYLRTFTGSAAADAARERTLQRIQAVAEEEGVRVLAFAFTEHAAPGAPDALVNEAGSGTFCFPKDKIRASEALGRDPVVIAHGFARLAEALTECETPKGPLQ